MIPFTEALVEQLKEKAKSNPVKEYDPEPGVRITEGDGKPERHYPKNDKYEFGMFAGFVFEFGGYGDISLINPYNGRSMWVSQNIVGKMTSYQAMHKILELAEKHNF